MFHWHRWTVVKDTGKHSYEECVKCKARRVVDLAPGYGYQPIDEGWVTVKARDNRGR